MGTCHQSLRYARRARRQIDIGIFLFDNFDFIFSESYVGENIKTRHLSEFSTIFAEN